MITQGTVNNKEKLLTYDEVADLLRTSAKTVERMTKQDPSFPRIAVGAKGVRFIWEDVLSYLRTKGNTTRHDIDLPGLR